MNNTSSAVTHNPSNNDAPGNQIAELASTAAQSERVVRCEMRCELEADVVKRTAAAFEQRRFG